MTRKLLVAGAFVATVYLANKALATWGTVPVGFGYEAPAGVYFAGLGFILRDALHELAGRGRLYYLNGMRDETMARVWVLGAILAGALLSYLLGADAMLGGHVSLAVASGLAFGLSEVCDLAVYSPLRDRTLPGAVGLSQVVGAAVDSAVFLWLAFGSLAFFTGQMIGKTLMVLPVVLGLIAWRYRTVRTLGAS